MKGYWRIELQYTAHYQSPLGGITIAGADDALTGLWFDGQKYFADTLIGRHMEGNLPILLEARRWMDIYFSGKCPDFTPKLTLRGSNFRKAVWLIMCTIPYGQTMTYKEIANKIAKERGIERMSAQAVGGAVGHNPISLIIPCHRVIGAKGSLTGYAGGIDKKIWLLKREGVDMSGLFT